jgi:hypothetical protein
MTRPARRREFLRNPIGRGKKEARFGLRGWISQVKSGSAVDQNKKTKGLAAKSHKDAPPLERQLKFTTVKNNCCKPPVILEANPP